MIGKRIKELRNALKKNQEDFARSLDVTHSAISQIENNKVNPSKKLLKLICSTHSVNREWLETGKGEMFKDTVDSLGRFSPAQRLLVEQFARYFAEKVPIVETDETMAVIEGLINILMSDNESAKRAIKSSILAVNQTLDSRENELPDPKPNPGSRTKRTKVG